MKNLYTLMGRTTHKTHETLRLYGSSFGKVAVLLIILLFSNFSKSQTVIVPAANTNTGSVNDPLGTYWGYERSAMIYTSAQIGATTGNITSVGFYLNSVATPGGATNVRIYMKMRTTLMTAITTYATEISGATLVYGPSSIPAASFVAGGWVSVNLTTPFNYTGGTNNLEIIIETNATVAGNEGATGKQFRYSSPGAVSSYQYWNQDNTAPTGNGTRSANRPNVKLTFAAVGACSGTPSPGNTVTSSASVASGSTVNLSLSTPPTGAGLTYQWQSSPNNAAPWTNVGTSAATYSPTVSATTWYRCIVTCGAASGTATAVQVTAIPINNIPYSGSSSVSCGTSTLIYDHGGSAGNYLDNANGYIVLNNAAGSTAVISITGTYNTEGSWDFLRIYNGTGTGGTLLASYSGSGTITPFTSAAGQTVTVQFQSDVSTVYSGIALNASYSGSCAAPACSGTPSPGNTVTSSASVTSGSTVNLSLSTPPVGTGLTYQWQSGPSNTGPWTNVGTSVATYSPTVTATAWYRCVVTCGAASGTATAVQVTAIIVNNIPYSGSSSVSCGTSTLIYDHGGSAGDYLDNANGYIVLNNAAGSTAVISLTGTYNTEGSWDFLRIYDGIGTGGTLLASYSGLSGTITPFTSAAGQTITVQFQSDVSTVYSGIALNAAYSGSCAVPACSGTPSPGNTVTSSALVASGSTVNLSLSTPPIGSGLTYQWQSGPSNTGPWTNVGTSAATYTATVTANTWYRCLVTCSGNTGTATPVFVELNLYCNPTMFTGANTCSYINSVTTSGASVNISTAIDAGFNSNIAAGMSYFPSPIITQVAGGSFTLSVQAAGTCLISYFSVWVDWNQNNTFEAGELMVNNVSCANNLTNFTIAVPASATVGITRMRIIDWSSSAPGVCANLSGFYGETEDYRISVTAAPPCSGTPSPGNSLTSSGSVSSGSTVNLTLSTPPAGTGLTYAWQSGPSNTGPWTTIATTESYTATVTAMTWYQCLVTCSGNTGTATPVQVMLAACTPVYTNGTSAGDLISNVSITGTTLANNTGFTAGTPSYIFYTGQPNYTATLLPSSSYTLNVSTGEWGDQGIAAWIDYNDDQVFSASEKIGTTVTTIGTGYTAGAVNASSSFTITLACNPPPGNHLMRIRGVYATTGPVIDPCASYTWGQTEDYIITIASAPACASPGLITSITPAANSATLTWATNCSAATNYDFQYGPAGFALGTGTMLTNQTVTISAPNASFNLTGLAGGTAYTVYYRANCGGGVTSAWSVANNFSTLAVWTDAWVSMNTGAAVWCPGETRVVTVTVTNTGNMTWTNATPDINIGVKWNAEADYFVRTDANGLAPGATQTYSLSMTAPLVLGTNNLTFDLVSENNFWFASNANGAGPSNVIYTSPTITISSPTVSAGAAMAAICQGTASAALGGSFGGTATSAVWSGGAGTFANNTGSTPGTATYTASASETGTITLTLTTSGGSCGTVFATNTIVVNANLPASVSIAASATTICDGTSVSFTATPTNGGAAPAYQWKVNGTNVGTNSATYTNAALANGNVVTCVLTSNATPCSTGSPATSNSITMVVNPNLPASISIAASATSICIGTSVTFTATPTNGGTTPAYQWKVNGANVGTGASTYASTTLANNDLVTCVLTSNASPCLTGSPATSNAVTITVNALPTITANVTSTPICLGSTTTLTGGGASTYSWDNGASNAVSFAPAATTTYTVTGTSAAGCTNTASVLVTVNTPTVTAPVVAGTVVWHGATSVDFGTSSNWLAYNGTSYAVSASAPTASTNVIIPVTQGCVTQQPSVVLSGTVAANDVVIESGATLSMGSGTLNIHGNYTNNGTLVGGTGTVAFVGASGDQTITKTGGETITSMTVNKAAGNVILNNNVTVTGGLSLTSGLVVLGTNDLIMSGGAISNASAASYVKTSDTGVFKHNVGSSVFNFPIGNGAYNPIDLTNSGTSDLFSVRVIDGAPGTPNNAINRKWMVERAGTANVNVTMRLYWNGVGDESSAFTASTGAMFIDHLTGGSWFNEGGTSNTASALNYVEKAGITSFSPFTVSRFATPLPVELMSLDAQCAGENVIVSWKTASEHNSLNFVVERSDDGTAWTEIQTVGAAGNSNTIIEYAIEDAGAARGVKYYRLIQVDQDGVQKIYGPILSNCGSDDNMFFSFPNPSDADITLMFTDKKINGSSTLTVRDAHGRVVRSIALEIQPGTTSILIPDMELEPAVYYLQLVGDNFTSPVIKHSLR